MRPTSIREEMREQLAPTAQSGPHIPGGADEVCAVLPMRRGQDYRQVAMYRAQMGLPSYPQTTLYAVRRSRDTYLIYQQICLTEGLAMLYTTSLADVLSNARVKKYPTSDVLQIANMPIFRRPGFEERERPYAVPAKGGARDPERSLAVSRARAKAAVRDIALCNQFSHFFTWTLDPKQIDRYDREAVKNRVYHFLKNTSHRKGFSYVCVPELHKDGAIHFHGMCSLGSVKIERAIDPYTGQPMTDASGRPIYNMSDWRLGFSICIPIDENYARTCNYLTKYLSKGMEKIFGKWYLSSRALTKRPDIELIEGGMDYKAFLEENPELPIIPLYRDVCMTTTVYQ